MTGMNAIALIVLGGAAFIRLMLLFPAFFKKVAAERQQFIDLCWFLFITGFILLFMFNFAMVRPLGNG
jgi:hypothetical protein